MADGQCAPYLVRAFGLHCIEHDIGSVKVSFCCEDGNDQEGKDCHDRGKDTCVVQMSKIRR